MGSPDPPLVAHIIHSLEGGGTERVLLRLLQQFDRGLVRHIVITLRQAGSLAAQLPDHVACLALETQGQRHFNGLRLARALHRLRPAIVHARNTCTWADATAAALLSRHCRLLLGFHGFENRTEFSSRDRVVSNIARMAGAEFTSVSQRGAQLLRSLGIPPHRIEVIPNGVQPQADDPAERNRIRKTLGIHFDDWVWGTVGSLTPVKGHETLLRAFSIVANSNPAVRLLLVGDGPLRPRLEQHAAQLGIPNAVIFAGTCASASEWLPAMDAYICASHSEEMSNALMEAMAAGLPVISTAVGDHPLLIRNDVEGWLVPAGDADSLAAAMRRMPEADTAKMGRSAARRMADFSFHRTLAAYESTYRRLLEGVGSMRPHTVVARCQKVSPLPRSLAPTFNH